jgi:hypothetical protein
MKPRFYFGYRMEPVANLNAAVADPAKALLDLLYLRPELAGEDQFEGLRLNLPELHRVLDRQWMERYLLLFAHPALTRRARRLLRYLEKNLSHAVSG